MLPAYSNKVISDFILFAFFYVFVAGVHLIQKSATCGPRDSPVPVFLRDMRATAL